MSKPRSQTQRTKSHYPAIRANLASEVSDSEDESISDISMDTCFRFQPDDEEVIDESEEEHVLQKKRSFRNSDPPFHENMLVVTPSFRRKPGLSKMMSSNRGGALKALTMENIDVNDRTHFLRFDSSEFLKATNQSKPPKTMQRRSSSLEDCTDEDTSDMFEKAKEFEDIDDKTLTSSQRPLEFEGISQDPFLSGDEEFAAMSKKRRKKKKKGKKEKDGGIDWDEVDKKGRPSLAAYSVAEGNIYPEISKVEAKHFKRSGNAWLEGRYSTNADWKRDASGMVLDIPTPSPKEKDKPKLNRPEGLVTDRIAERPQKSTPTQGRTELYIVVAPAPIAPIAESVEAKEKEQDSHTPLPELTEKPASKASKSSDRRSLFLRANSMPSFTLGSLQRVFKRSTTPSSDNSDGESLLEESLRNIASGFVEALIDETLIDETIDPRAVTSVATSINAPNNAASTQDSKGTSSSSTQRKRSGSVGEITPLPMQQPRRRRSDSIGKVRGERSSKSKTKKDRSTKKESKAKIKDTSDQSRRRKYAAVVNAINTESPHISLRRIKSLGLGAAGKLSTNKQESGMSRTGEKSPHSKKGSKAKVNDTLDHARRSKLAAVMIAINTESSQTTLRRTKSLEAVAIGKRSTKKQESGMSPIGENASHKGRLHSEELRNAIKSRPPKAGLPAIKSFDPTASARLLEESQKENGSNAPSVSSDDSGNGKEFFVLELPIRKLRNKSDGNDQPMNRKRTKSFDTDKLEGYHVEADESQNYDSPKERVEDFTLSHSTDFEAGLNVPLKVEKRYVRGTYCGSSDDSNHKAPKKKHRRRTTSVSSNDDDASERKSSKRRSIRSATRSGQKRPTSHSSEDLEEGTDESFAQETNYRRSSHSSNDVEALSTRSDYRGPPQKRNSSEALEEIISMSSRLEASTGSFSLKSDDGSDGAKVVQQLSRDGGMDEARKCEKKQRKKEKRRSSSVPKPRVVDAELATGKSKAKEDHSEKSRREHGSTHRRRRSTSIPKRAEVRAADEPRKRGGSVETKFRDRGSIHRRRRGSSVPRATAAVAAERLSAIVAKEEVAQNRAAQDKSEVAPLSSNSYRPCRRLLVGGVNPEDGGIVNISKTAREASAEQASRSHRRRRSLNLGGEVISSQGVDDAEAPIQVRERNESHQYVGFSVTDGLRRATSADFTPPESVPPDKPIRASFLSRFAKLEHEATASKQTVARRSMMQSAQSERSLKYNSQMPSAKKSYTPTFKELPGKQTSAAASAGGAYSDMVMQGKIGFTAAITES